MQLFNGISRENICQCVYRDKKLSGNLGAICVGIKEPCQYSRINIGVVADAVIKAIGKDEVGIHRMVHSMICAV